MPVFEAKVKCKRRYSLFVIRYSAVYADYSFEFNMEVGTVERLIAKEVAIDLCVYVYALTKSFPREERYGLTSQLRRCVVSVPSNIAEGTYRHSLKEFLRFLYVAKALLLSLTLSLRLQSGLAISRILQMI